MLTTSSLFGTGAGTHPAAGMNPSLLFNAQLALASQNPFFSHAYHALSSQQQQQQQNHHLKAAALASGVHRFAPYSLPLVPPSLANSSPLGSAFDAVLPNLSNRCSSGASSPNLQKVKSPSLSPKSDKSLLSPKIPTTNSTLNELKSMEKMVNGLESNAATNNFSSFKQIEENNITSSDVNGNKWYRGIFHTFFLCSTFIFFFLL